jgi:hypothetical protein
MKNFAMICSACILVLLLAGSSFGQIYLDGDDADWGAVPYAVEEWVNGEEGLYPDEVGAIVTDNVDIKSVKAVIMDNTLFWYLQFWGGPAWPNDAKKREEDGVPITRTRGYYHVLLDLDNNVETGWKTDWYEAHYTTVGYLASQGFEGAEPIGAEVWVEWGAKYYYPPPHSDSGGIKNDGVQEILYWMDDWSEYDGVSDNELEYDISEFAIPDPDSADGMMWQGTSLNQNSFNEDLANDSLRYFWWGHAWGEDFMEVGSELTPIIEYFEDKGFDYFNEGDVIGVAGFSETPADDWGVDITTRGQIVCPKIKKRPSSIAFDGDDSDWADVPMAVEEWVNGEEGLYPDEVGAIVTDNVDIKDVKAFVNAEEEAIYWFLRFWGGPAWPNDAKQREVDGVPISRTRGYYHVLLDLDNNIETGWKTDWYEAHYTTVGYLASQGFEGAEPLGAEVWVEWGAKYFYPPPHNDSGGVKNDGVDEILAWLDDWSEYDGVSDNELEFTIGEYALTDPDSASGQMHDGLVPNQDSFDQSLLTGVPEFFAHAWGWDFLEAGNTIAPIKKYFMTKTGEEFFKPGDVIGVCGFSETPADDWGVDITTRGEIVVGEVTAVAKDARVIEGYELANNYPNPFNPTTTINYRVPVNADVSIVIYNTLGQIVRTLVDSRVAEGMHSVVWDGRNDAGMTLPTGLYYYNLETENFSETKKMMLIK